MNRMTLSMLNGKGIMLETLSKLSSGIQTANVVSHTKAKTRLRKLNGPEHEKMTENLGKLYNEELQNTGFWLRSLKKKDGLQDLRMASKGKLKL
jgi:hypothetical protein